MNKKERDISFDIAKGLSIISVVLGHCIQFNGRNYFESGECWNNVFLQFLYSFNMPMLMIISGYLCVKSVKKYSYKFFFKKKFSQLIVPIISFTILELLCFDYDDQIQNMGYVKFIIFLFITSLWFLWALFFFQNSLYFVIKYKINYGIVFLVVFLLMFLIPNKITTIGWGLSIAPEFFLGAFISEHKGFKYIDNIKSLALFGISFCVLFYFYNKDCFVYTTGCYIFNGNMIYQIFIDIYRCLIGIIGSFFVIVLIRTLLNSSFTFQFKVLPYLGTVSMGIYIISIFIVMLEDKLLDYTIAEGVYNVPLNFTFTIIISIFITNVLRKIKILDLILLGGM